MRESQIQTETMIYRVAHRTLSGMSGGFTDCRTMSEAIAMRDHWMDHGEHAGIAVIAIDADMLVHAYVQYRGNVADVADFFSLDKSVIMDRMDVIA